MNKIKELEEKFRSNFDPGKMTHLMERFNVEADNFLPQHFLGEGYHFKSWLLQQNGNLDTVLKIATQQFWDDRKELGVRKWKDSIEYLRRSDIPFFHL